MLRKAVCRLCTLRDCAETHDTAPAESETRTGVYCFGVLTSVTSCSIAEATDAVGPLIRTTVLIGRDCLALMHEIWVPVLCMGTCTWQ